MTADVKNGPRFGVRHLQVFLLFLSIVVNYVAKLNVGVAVVAMTNAETTNPNFKEFNWQEKEKSYILSSFYWGYALTQFLGGYLCRRYGAKVTMFISILGSALLAILTPFVLYIGSGWGIYCAVRMVQGLFQGLQFPCIHAHLAAWCPPIERNRLGALSQTGIECGTVLAMFASGLIAASRIGWPGIFYTSGAVGLCWCLLWLIFGANHPRESTMISLEERIFVETSLNQDFQVKPDESAGKIPVPWAAILSSMPFWALLVARSAQAWGFSTLQAEIPSYMNGVLMMDMKTNALYSALPYMAMWCMSYIYLIIADILLSREAVSLVFLRKTFNSLAFWVPAVGLVAVGFVGERHKTLAVILMTATVGINAGSTIGSALNTIDLSPNHAGIIMGIVNTSANFTPILTPLLVGVIVTNEHNRSEWQIVFIISAIIFTAGNLFYVIFGSADLQPWNDANFLNAQRRETEKGNLNDYNKDGFIKKVSIPKSDIVYVY